MTKKFCELISEGLDVKLELRKDILKRLDIAKHQNNEERIMLISKEDIAILSNIQQVSMVLYSLKVECPLNLKDSKIDMIEKICNTRCSWYYDYLKNRTKI
jgi:hypothetical protein